MGASFRLRVLSVVAAVMAMVFPFVVRADAAAAGGPVIVLDTLGFWRMHHTLAPPLLQSGDGVKPILYAQRWLNGETAEAAGDWMKAGFADSSWPRLPGRLCCHTPYLSRLCLRGKFMVSDPGAVQGLSVNVVYCGGAVVYFNGEEIGRGNVAKGAGTIADAYPAAAFAVGDGKQSALRERKLTVEVPAGLVQKGVNVLAIEIVRAAYNQAADVPKEKGDAKEKLYAMPWNTCDLKSVRLTAAGTGGLVANASRPAGIQAWNNDILNSDYDLDFGDPCEKLLPVAIGAARNGVGSGKVVIGSDGALKDLAVRVSELKFAGGVIPSGAVRVRYGMPWGREHMGEENSDPYGAPANLLGELVDAPLKEYAVGKVAPRGAGQAKLVNGAVVPIWFTVKVPANAAAGVYKGEAIVKSEGNAAISVPIELTVFSYAVPDPQDFQTWVELIESPDTLAMEYKDELWSDKNWERIGESFKYFNEIGSRVVYVPLIAHTNLGNEESMVRWIEKPDKTFDYDFSVMDKYLDVAEKNMGRPKIVEFNVWDVYMIPSRENGGAASGGNGGHRRMVNSFDAAQAAKLGSGPLVTVIDPATKKTEDVYLPVYADAKSKGLWQPLLEAVKKHMEKRGLEKAMMLGMVTDAMPTKEEVAFFKDTAPGVPWVSEGHGGFEVGQKLQNISPVGYQTTVWMTRFADEVLTHGVLTKPEDRVYGWKQPQLLVDFERNPDLFSYPMSRWYFFGETNVTGFQRGMGRIAGDYWLAMKDKRGRRSSTVTGRFPESAWMNLNICNPILAPGPDGPVATTRYEAMREGVEECEARTSIEKVLADPAMKAKLGGVLAGRCQKMLDDRMPIMWRSLSNLELTGARWGDARLWRWTPGNAGQVWFLGSGWEGRAESLYSLAGEVSGKINGK